VSDEDFTVTAREREVIQALVVGATAREVAVQLKVSWHTARTHIRNVYSKIGVSNRIELVRWYIDANYCGPDTN
jgi:DNA-binding NarL/FixJ family response regulator